MSCSASQHAGKTNVSRPSASETNEALWFTYWQDQFDAYEGNVVAPTTPQYPEVAIQAYQQAKAEWNHKADEAATKTKILLIVGLGGLGLAVSLLVIGSAGK